MAALAEPTVLAAAKDALYPDISNQPSHYAVTETQFTQTQWGSWPIPESVRDRLAPFNTIRLSSGEPDLLGVGMPSTDVLNAEAAKTPVVAIEAKGSNLHPAKADIGRGIEQAHSHLPEVNLAYVAAPMQSITPTARSLARDLNIGVIGVESDDSVTFVEPARISGAGEFSTGVEAIRFQASTHGLTEGSFPLNHPKNYLGYALALAADGETETVYAENIVDDPGGGRRGAIILGLIDAREDGEYLTHAGAEVVRFGQAQCGSVDAALTQFDDWAGKRMRFTRYAPRWAQLARSVTMGYEPTKLIVDALESLHRDGMAAPTFPQLVKRACDLNQPLGVEVFFTQGRRDDVLTPDGEIDQSQMDDPDVYKSGSYFQYKAQLFHVGLVTTRGTDDGEEAVSDTWQLEHPLGTL
ncbi:hypothetical protein [Halomarina rubra]|uniref:Uncharacterized protein n=1 Tax=Halomarina rubra TaxID=2071873 RepID=A0ABD6AV30_9EURY|nr:hypothetical protein [Halomarina rubra]